MVDFTRLIKDKKFRKEDEFEYAGVKKFRREFIGGYLAETLSKIGLIKPARNKAETLAIIVNSGLAKTQEEALGVFEELINEMHHISPEGGFRLKRLVNRRGEEIYIPYINDIHYAVF